MSKSNLHRGAQQVRHPEREWRFYSTACVRVQRIVPHYRGSSARLVLSAGCTPLHSSIRIPAAALYQLLPLWPNLTCFAGLSAVLLQIEEEVRKEQAGQEAAAEELPEWELYKQQVGFIFL